MTGRASGAQRIQWRTMRLKSPVFATEMAQPVPSSTGALERTTMFAWPIAARTPPEIAVSP